ncbi:putative membrane protein [Pullulanibacillus pueri]|uniref:DUF1700 domain-containing protein n=1 Tax=Pullulanibacillus pueri TaxID=1437324 RepID=A0A8J2ZQS1_9BACL|nr:DUF1700 domain-containing protein [Pullulanibacillus pueri]MBM7679942.1 putative membrane protein [Pullulanibacillus pueri]GGH73604.1 hypothetical protein GCM10007096_00990 [Pullulanibacillus pueri]
MTKERFLKELEASLKRLTAAEREDILRDYKEHFAFGLEEGKTEEEIASGLGSPQHIAKELLAEYHLEKLEATATTGNIMRAVWAVIGLSFFNLIIVLGPFIGFAGVVIAGWAVGVSFILSPLLVLIDLAITPSAFNLFNLFSSILLCGLGIFILVGMLHATKYIAKGFIRYLKYNASLVKGGLKRD